MRTIDQIYLFLEIDDNGILPGYAIVSGLDPRGCLFVMREECTVGLKVMPWNLSLISVTQFSLSWSYLMVSAISSRSRSYDFFPVLTFCFPLQCSRFFWFCRAFHVPANFLRKPLASFRRVSSSMRMSILPGTVSKMTFPPSCRSAVACKPTCSLMCPLRVPVRSFQLFFDRVSSLYFTTFLPKLKGKFG